MPAPTAAPLTAAMYGFSMIETSRGMRWTLSRRKLRLSTCDVLRCNRERPSPLRTTSAPVQNPRPAARKDHDPHIGIVYGRRVRARTTRRASAA